MSRPTIADVAKHAGVSKATVSRVLSGNYDYMRENTKQRVEASIEALDYRPSSVARSLTSKRTYTMAIMVSDVGNPFYADVIHGAEDAALNDGYNLYLCNTNYDLKRGLALIQSFVDKRVDGVLIMSSTMSDTWLDELSRNNVPAVVLDWNIQSQDREVSSIGVDFQPGIQEAVDHLIELGHRTFAHVSGPLDLQTSATRRDAFLNALAGHGIDPTMVPVVEGNLQIDGGREALIHIASLTDRPTAVFTANDLTAMGLMTEAANQHIQVPDELSIIGLDDIWLATQIVPALTTVALPRYEIGRQAVQMLFDLLDGKPATSAWFETSLTIRQTTTHPPENRLDV